MTARDTPVLEIIVAHSAGTCFGVEDAIELAEDKRQPILGQLVHNPLTVKRLSDQGIPILERYSDLDELEGRGTKEVIITAHGYPRELKEALAARGIVYHDATCPVLLKWVYGKILHFEERGYRVILIGNPDHAEIIASRSYGTDIHVVYSPEDVAALPDDPGRTVAVCQTTITREKFEYLVGEIRATKYPDLKAIDTRCKPVKNQQRAIERLAEWVDAMVIVGGFNSSNTTNLARISRIRLPERTYHIDDADMVEAGWLDGVEHLGIGAGTSTPKSQIRAVQQRIAELFPGRIVYRTEDRRGELQRDDFGEDDEV
ncbi:MAG: 4-hydroxy-3-methylbut-2-enyl diphosphate reductase [Gemmatimonadota bacterium]|jgi:4-hydroxy-3-methylbut-2-enyl diphosphate reductase|nr:4-hydroxy-3-methylbut-2-enyl diphosphate reductase [Gemmatimonadota bacterium]MDP6802362.1 4-hydroxy-3-methylbut-2-enyl diphosphate reductase [Gemmatimonadota bacterium]MDP7031124.1 4-hydroxy-3-methylbut-2-enyl diphosphate reductase [Gemmatimonadota bacterium]